MATATDRSLDDFTSLSLARSAYVGGIDARHRFLKDNYELSGFLAASTVRGSAAAINGLQLDSRHNFRRPDAKLPYDSTATQLGGNAGHISFAKVGGGITRFNLDYRELSPGFEINDVGYLSRADQKSFSGWMGLQYNKPTAFYRQARLNFNQWSGWTTDGLRTELGGNVNFHVQLPTMWWIHTGISSNGWMPTYDDRASRGGPGDRPRSHRSRRHR